MCLTHELWSNLSGQMYLFLDGITLSDVVQWPQVKAVAARQDAQLARANGSTTTVPLSSVAAHD